MAFIDQSIDKWLFPVTSFMVHFSATSFALYSVLLNSKEFLTEQYSLFLAVDKSWLTSASIGNHIRGSLQKETKRESSFLLHSFLIVPGHQMRPQWVAVNTRILSGKLEGLSSAWVTATLSSSTVFLAWPLRSGTCPLRNSQPQWWNISVALRLSKRTYFCFIFMLW